MRKGYDNVAQEINGKATVLRGSCGQRPRTLPVGMGAVEGEVPAAEQGGTVCLEPLRASGLEDEASLRSVLRHLNQQLSTASKR